MIKRKRGSILQANIAGSFCPLDDELTIIYGVVGGSLTSTGNYI